MTAKQQGPRSFEQAVTQVVRRIPEGRVMTYAEVAAKAGFPRAARAVGTLMKQNYDPAIPCHRVIRSDGRIGAYNRGARRKEELLTREGVAIENGRVQSRT